jgi:hypothetical protein
LTDLVPSEVENRLAVEQQTVFLEGGANQLRLEKPRRNHLAVASARSVHGDPIPAGLLGLVHREVGELQHLSGAQTVEQGDADARRDVNRLLAEYSDLPAQSLDDPLGDDHGLIGVRLREQHGEFISAHARHDIRAPNAVIQRSGDSLEEIVTGLVAEAVVHVFEVVQVDHEHGAVGAVTRHALGLVGQFLLEAPPVEQSGQEVVFEEILQAGRLSPSLRDILNLRDVVERHASIIPDDGRGHQHPDVMTPCVLVALLDLAIGDLPVKEIAHRIGVAIEVVGMRDGLKRRPA